MKYIENICKIGRGNNCCRYLIVSAKGFECAKLSSLKRTIDNKVKSMVAQSDNCDGKPENTVIS